MDDSQAYDPGQAAFQPPFVPGDLAIGCTAITKALHGSARPSQVKRTRVLIAQGLLPAFWWGNAWCARRTTLAAYFAELEAEARARHALHEPQTTEPRDIDQPVEPHAASVQAAGQ